MEIGDPDTRVESPSGVFQSAISNGEGDGSTLRGQQQNGFSEAAPRTTTFNSPLLTSLFSGGGLGGINSQRPTTPVTGVTDTNLSSDSALSSSRNNNMHSGESQQPHPPASNLAMGTVGNASNNRAIPLLQFSNVDSLLSELLIIMFLPFSGTNDCISLLPPFYLNAFSSGLPSSSPLPPLIYSTSKVDSLTGLPYH
ncbi:hypothetical protein ACTXT7_013033 [Hymenolepis weldensis]